MLCKYCSNPFVDVAKHILWLRSLYLRGQGAILHPLCTYPRYEPCSLPFFTFLGERPDWSPATLAPISQDWPRTTMSQFNAIVLHADAMQAWPEGAITCHNPPYDLSKDRYLMLSRWQTPLLRDTTENSQMLQHYLQISGARTNQFYKRVHLIFAFCNPTQKSHNKPTQWRDVGVGCRVVTNPIASSRKPYRAINQPNR